MPKTYDYQLLSSQKTNRDAVSQIELIRRIDELLAIAKDANAEIENVLMVLAKKNADIYQERLNKMEKSEEFRFQNIRPAPIIRHDPTDPEAPTRIIWRVATYVRPMTGAAAEVEPSKKSRKNVSDKPGWTPPNSKFTYRDIPAPRTGQYGRYAFLHARSFRRREVCDLAVATDRVFFEIREIVSRNRDHRNKIKLQIKKLPVLKTVIEDYEDTEPDYSVL